MPGGGFQPARQEGGGGVVQAFVFWNALVVHDARGNEGTLRHSTL